MQQSYLEMYPSQTDEITIKKLVLVFKDNLWTILGLTGFITLLAIAYALTIPPAPKQYKATASFISPSDSSVIAINRFPLTSETAETIFTKYLKKLSSTTFKEKVFYSSDYLDEYLATFNHKNRPIADVENSVSEFINSIELNKITTTKKTEILLENAYTISMQGNNAEFISRFLNEIITSADRETINDFFNNLQNKIDIHIEEISAERALLLNKAKQVRLSKINKIKENDSQEIRKINNLIEALRIKAKQNRINNIELLIEEARIAHNLGFIDNNLEQFSESDTNINLNIDVSEGESNLPEWYLYGEIALLEKIELLKNRSNDDPFIPEILLLEKKIYEIQNNSALKTLQERQDEIPFITVINKVDKDGAVIDETNLIHELDYEKHKLESTTFSDSSGINAIQLTKTISTREIPIKSNKKLIVIGAFIFGLVFSMALAMLINVIKEDEPEPTTKTSS